MGLEASTVRTLLNLTFPYSFEAVTYFLKGILHTNPFPRDICLPRSTMVVCRWCC